MTKVHKTQLLKRTPVIAVMGHVDHGKTTILDVIRNTNVQASEEGGITQNTRAHQIDFNGQKITFIDTPGHEAFREMRSRGAKVTDIVLLVVAADDGVQPQTIESIKFAQEAKVPIVVAINKMDLPGANPKKVKQELSQHNVLVEEFGGDVLTVEISAKLKKNIDGLLETLILQAEMLELKEAKVAQGTAEAFVLESTLNKKRGPLSLILVKAGSIKVGDYVIYTGKADKIRAILDEHFIPLTEAHESDPVWLVGLSNVLKTGEVLLFSSEQKESEKLANGFQHTIPIIKVIKQEADEEPAGDVDELALLVQMMGNREQESKMKYLNLVLKCDSQGTLEAVREKIESLGDDQVKVKILSAGTGMITEKDILTAKNSKGLVVGFQSEISPEIEMIAKREKVLLRNYLIIYQLIEEVEMVLQSMLDPEEEIVEVARSKVKQVFTLSDGKIVAGVKVLKGLVIRGYKCFVMRGNDELGNGKIISLKQQKEDVKEVKKDQECGIIIEPVIPVEEGDEIICYKVEKA